MRWTDEAVETLRRLAAEGLSASAIAAELAASRNAVIGKANRLGVKLGGGAAAGAAVETSPARGLSGKAPATRTPRSWIFAEAEVGEMRRLRFEEAPDHACRWPLGDPRGGDLVYCGLAPAAGRPYCAGHCRMAYRTGTR